MDYKKIAEQLRKDAGYCTLESCKECAGNGKCPTQNMLYAADTIDHLMIESNNYRKALDAMTVENGRQKAEIKQDNEICKKCYESRVLAETRGAR